MYVRAIDLPGIDPKHRPEFRTKLEMGVELLRLGPDVAEVPGQADLGGGRRGLCQGPVPQAGDRPGDDGGQPAPQGRGPAHRARPRVPGRRGRPRIYGEERIVLAERAVQRRGWTTRGLRALRQAGGEAVPDLPGDVAAGRRGDPGGPGRRAEWVGGLLLHRPDASVADILATVADRFAWRRPSAIARRSWGRGSSRYGSCGRTSVHSTSASGHSR